jgi:hypothetical protein
LTQTSTPSSPSSWSANVVDLVIGVHNRLDHRAQLSERQEKRREPVFGTRRLPA